MKENILFHNNQKSTFQERRSKKPGNEELFGVVVECNENIDKVRANSGAQQVNSLEEVLEQKEMFLRLQKLSPLN